MDYIIGIDMGGTGIKAGVFSNDGNLLKRKTALTSDGEMLDGHPAWAVNVRRLVRELEEESGSHPRAIGFTSPGLASKDQRCITTLPNRLKGLEGFDWTSWLGFEKLVPVLNDAHAALLGEVWQGAARGMQDAILLTLGTGVGGAILSEGRLIRGHTGRAGHLGHVSVNRHGPVSIAGMPGALECFMGNYTVAERSRGRFTSTKALVEAVRAGDVEAANIWHDSVHALAVGIASFINAFDPERVIVGGGIAETGDVLWKPLSVELDRIEWRPQGYQTQIVKAELGDWAGAYGAAYQALRV